MELMAFTVFQIVVKSGAPIYSIPTRAPKGRGRSASGKRTRCSATKKSWAARFGRLSSKRKKLIVSQGKRKIFVSKRNIIFSKRIYQQTCRKHGERWPNTAKHWETLVCPKGWAGAGVGNEMLRGGGDFFNSK